MADLGAGCGMRQGEIFGLPHDEVEFLTGWLHIGYQVKLVNGHPVFAPPKGGKVRDVPLPKVVGHVLTPLTRSGSRQPKSPSRGSRRAGPQ